ncbi:MAG: suppressor of fused domain protein [Deltaproteobacteria bacterium]|jgi:hypothetical protein|nr:suppressor of fused domain protein [Deltaproteobacteria bacterium]
MKQKLDRAEFLLTLPPCWKLEMPEGADPKWYWPIQTLVEIAYTPWESSNWLGWGCLSSLTTNNMYSGVLITYPYPFGQESFRCSLPDGDEVVFYKLLALFPEEYQYALSRSAKSLEIAMPYDFNLVNDPKRTNFLLP